MNAEIKGKDVNMDLRGERGLKRLVFFHRKTTNATKRNIFRNKKGRQTKYVGPKTHLVP